MEECQITVTRATVICSEHGPDTILLDTTLLDGCYPFDGKQMDCAAGTGVDYVKKHLKLEPIVVNR